MLHYEWLESSYEGLKCSEHGRHVAQILGITFGGLYHIMTKLEKVKWDSENAISINICYGALSTFDFDRLTKLIILCHDACIRLEIQPVNFRYLRLWFHRRNGRTGNISRRHPTIEQAIIDVRECKGPKLEDRVKREEK